MVSKKNGDIRSFFLDSQASSRPPTSQTRPSRTPRAAAPGPISQHEPDDRTPPSPSPSPLPDIPSSPPFVTPDDDTTTTTTGHPTPRGPISRNAVIAASDDEPSDSDDDLFPDLGLIGAPRRAGGPASLAAAPRNPAPAPAPAPASGGRRAPNKPCVTPRARRTAAVGPPDFLSSPLTIQSKKKRYDMKELLEFTRRDEETWAGAQRFSALLEQEAEMQRGGRGFVDDDDDGGGDDGDDDVDVDDAEGAGRAAAVLREHILESAVAAGGDEGDEEGGGPDKMRIVRALERTELGGDSRRYYFFEQEEPEADVVGTRFPKQKAKGAWAILGDAQDRARHFASGFPYDIQKKLGNMPDEIFLWILDEVCSERRRPLQVEYGKLLVICHDQTRRLVTPTLLQQLFINLGATKDVNELKARVTLREETNNPYPNRNWSCVENFLDLLGKISEHFSSATRTTAMQILMRLGMDGIAVENFGYAQKWRQATDLVARSVPDGEWVSFCRDVCSSLHKSSQKATMRWRAIVLLGPYVTPAPSTCSIHLQARTLDLKRRLASAYFFDDLQRADKRPEDTVHIRAVIDRLEGDEFQINQNSDYQELGALMMMLNVALGDASKHVEMTGQSAINFDAEVDELAEGLKSMLTRVAPLNKGIHVFRIEAKNAMELIRERLLYQVRIKNVPKIGVFGRVEDEDSSLPRQRDFMKGFLKKKRESSARAESDAIKTEPTFKFEVDAIMAG